MQNKLYFPWTLKNEMIGMAGSKIFASVVVLFFMISSGHFGICDNITKSMDLETTYLRYKSAQKDYEKSLLLYKEGLLSQSELQKMSSKMEIRRIELQKAIYSFMSGAVTFNVLSVTKGFEQKSGRIYLHVCISATTSNPSSITALGIDAKDIGLLDKLVRRPIRNVFISVLENGVIIARPYRYHLPVLKPGTKTICKTFQLLKDASEIIVRIEWEGKVKDFKVIPVQSGSSQILRVDLEQNSLIGIPGKTCHFRINFEKYSLGSGDVSFRVEGLPIGYLYYFVDVGNGDKKKETNRLMRLFFDKNQRYRKVDLDVNIPENLDIESDVDKKIEFKLHVLFEGKEIGVYPLEIIPRGQGKIVLESKSYLLNIAPGAKGVFYLQIKNVGSAAVRNVKIENNSAFQCGYKFDPPEIKRINPGERKMIMFEVYGNEDLLKEGIYVISCKAKAESQGKKIETDPVDLKINIVKKADSNKNIYLWILIFGIGLIVLIFVLLRFSKR